MTDLQQRVTTEKTAVDVLREARALIEKGWCQWAYARDSNGCSVDELEPSAVCFCVLGAMKCASNVSAIRGTPAAEYLASAVGTHQLADWNDKAKRTQAEILAAFDRAIELAQSEVSHA